MNVAHHTRIKFCGMTRERDVRAACALGVWAIGMVFAQRSKRRVDAVQARALRDAVVSGVEAVALFMDNPADEVRAVVAQVRPSLLQFHGAEDEAFCRSFGLPYMKALAMGGESAASVDAAVARYPSAQALLLDSNAQGGAGGTGHPFDWSRIPAHIDTPWLLAGGIGPDNVFDAIQATHPWGVDVASGIESAPGEKDLQRMQRFVEEVRRADAG